MDKVSCFPWYGGKFLYLDFLLPLFPKDVHHFVDVFGGSASVILNIDPFPSMTYNDVDREIFNFFRTLRENKEELIESIRLTPYSRDEFELTLEKDENLSDVEKARRFYVKAKQCFAGKTQAATKGYWRFSVNSMSYPFTYMNGVDKLAEIYERLINIQIENKPALDILERYDHEDTFFYLDPPYVHSTRNKTVLKVYNGEMLDDDHRELGKVLNNIKGKALVSGYRSELYGEIFAGWDSLDCRPKRTAGTMKIEHSIETVWANYELNTNLVQTETMWNDIFNG